MSSAKMGLIIVQICLGLCGMICGLVAIIMAIRAGALR
jgi:hypothetical protein